MTDILLPLWLPVAALDLGVQDATAADSSAVTGLTQTSEIFGVRKRLHSLQFETIDRRSGNLAVLRAFQSSMQGRKNRVWVTDPSYQQRGSFPGGELLANSDFSNGLSGWTFGSTSGAPVTSVSDRRLRIEAHSSVGNYFAQQTPAVVVNAPYAMRAFFETGNSRNSANKKARLDDGVIVRQSGGIDSGYAETWYVPPAATVNAIAWFESALTAGEYFSVALTSLSRCALVDGGAQAIQQSADIANSAWASSLNITRAAAVTVAPDGSSSGARITSSNVSHYLAQSFSVPSAAADFSASYAVKADSQSWAFFGLSDFSIAGCTAYVNLSTGAVSSISGAMTNIRATSTSLGSGWWLVTITARKTASTTSMSAFLGVASGDGLSASSGSIFAWRPTISQNSVPGRLVGSGATAAPTGTAQPGTTIFLKGLPASTNGLLLTGDRVQIGSRLREVIAPLNSNAAGHGVLLIDEPVPGGVADNAPVIVNNPMGRFMLAGEIGLSLTPGVFGNSSLPLVEA